MNEQLRRALTRRPAVVGIEKISMDEASLDECRAWLDRV